MPASKHRVEWYPGAEHGFAFPQRHCFHKPSAERHWVRLFDLFERDCAASSLARRAQRCAAARHHRVARLDAAIDLHVHQLGAAVLDTPRDRERLDPCRLLVTT